MLKVVIKSPTKISIIFLPLTLPITSDAHELSSFSGILSVFHFLFKYDKLWDSKTVHRRSLWVFGNDSNSIYSTCYCTLLATALKIISV